MKPVEPTLHGSIIPGYKLLRFMCINFFKYKKNALAYSGDKYSHQSTDTLFPIKLTIIYMSVDPYSSGAVLTTLMFPRNLRMGPISYFVTLQKAGKACQGRS